MNKLPRGLGASHLYTWKSAGDYAWLSENMNENENIKYDNEPASKGFGVFTPPPQRLYTISWIQLL